MGIQVTSRFRLRYKQNNLGFVKRKLILRLKHGVVLNDLNAWWQLQPIAIEVTSNARTTDWLQLHLSLNTSMINRNCYDYLNSKPIPTFEYIITCCVGYGVGKGIFEYDFNQDIDPNVYTKPFSEKGHACQLKNYPVLTEIPLNYQGWSFK